MNIYENENQDQEQTHMTYDQYVEYKQTCEELLRQAEMAAKLPEIPEFKEIIMDAYFDQEPKRLAGLMTTGRLNEKQFDECVKDLRAIGAMRSFLQDYIQKGNIAKGELEGLEEAWNEAVKEGSVDGETS